MIEEKENNFNNNEPSYQSHWEKYKIYYLVFGSFFLLTFFIITSNFASDNEIRKTNKLLYQLQEKLFPSNERFPENDNPPSLIKSGDFWLTDPSKQKEDWLEETVFQDSVRQKLQELVNSIKYLPNYRIGGTRETGQHALFYGPPGTGKSYLAEMFGKNEAVAYTFADVGTKKYAGSAKIAVTKIFLQAKSILKQKGDAKPVVIIIDEIDSVGIKNPELSPASTEEVNAILTMIDEIEREKLNIVVIGITNYPEKIDDALVRSGRLGERVGVVYPTNDEMEKMVKSLEKEVSTGKFGSYKYLGNKQKWEEEQARSQFFIELAGDFWADVRRISKEKNQECIDKKVGLSFVDLQKNLSRTFSSKISKNSEKIVVGGRDFQTKLEETIKDKLWEIKKNNPLPTT